MSVKRLDQLEDNVEQQQDKGKKFDNGKPRMSLVPQAALMEVAKVMTMGAVKYGDYNWKHGLDWSRLSDASLRHSAQWLDGIGLDDESGLSHLAHAAANLLMLLEFELKNEGKDDRYDNNKERESGPD